jgi:hypothetical protein
VFDAANYHVTETLTDGRKVEIRALRPDDRDGLPEAVLRCTRQTIYHRFFSMFRAFTERDAQFFLGSTSLSTSPWRLWHAKTVARQLSAVAAM